MPKRQSTEGPLKVMHIITGTDVGGAENQVVLTCQRSRPGQMRHHVVGLGPRGPMAARMEAGACRVTSLGLRPGPGALLRGLPALVRLLRRERPDVVQTWMYHADLLGLLAARAAGCGPVVWGVMCSDELHRHKWHTRLVVRACVRLSAWPAAIQSNSVSGLEFHAGLGYPRHKMVVIPNGFLTDEFRPSEAARGALRAELGLPPEALVVGHAARHHPMKDHANLLAAAELVLARLPQAHFALAGRGVTPDNPALAAALRPPLAGRVRLLGERHDMARFMAGLDLHVNCSAYGEGLPNVVGESMSCGVPNVVTRLADNPVVVGQAGRVVPPRDPAALAGAICELLELPAEARAELGRAARQRIVDRFSVDNMVGGYYRLYQHLLGHTQA